MTGAELLHAKETNVRTVDDANRKWNTEADTLEGQYALRAGSAGHGGFWVESPVVTVNERLRKRSRLTAGRRRPQLSYMSTRVPRQPAGLTQSL
jgi:hypothetical protein